MLPLMPSCESVFDLNLALRLIHSAHSFATALCVSSFFRRISNSPPHNWLSVKMFGMKNSLFSFFSFSVTKVGRVKINSSPSTLPNSLRSASYAYMEKAEAAILSMPPPFSSLLRSSPRRTDMLSILFILVEVVIYQPVISLRLVPDS